MSSGKTQSYHIRDIIYSLYKDNIFQNKKKIKFISITDPSFIKDTSNFGHCMELIDAAVKPNNIVSIKKNLGKADLIFLMMTLMSSAS